MRGPPACSGASRPDGEKREVEALSLLSKAIEFGAAGDGRGIASDLSGTTLRCLRSRVEWLWERGAQGGWWIASGRGGEALA